MQITVPFSKSNLNSLGPAMALILVYISYLNFPKARYPSLVASHYYLILNV